MKTTIIFLLLMLANIFYTKAQGIEFEKNLTWAQIKQKAKKENKSIFIDAYATWCIPCKIMDENIYPTKEAGDALNKNFISVKIQMDKTGNDSEYVRSWYKDSDELSRLYNVSAFPTLICVNAEGALMGKQTGSSGLDKFLSFIKDAQDPAKQYDFRMEAYRKGTQNLQGYPELVALANQYGDKKLAYEIGLKYKTKYLDKKTDNELLGSKTDILFLLNNYKLVPSNDRFFKYCFHTPKLVDSNKIGAINWFTTLVINQEEIEEKLWKDGTKTPIKKEPNWTSIYSSIKSKYGREKADYLVNFNKSYFYHTIGNWREYASIVESDLEKYSPKKGDGNFAFDFNNKAWLVFTKCNDKNVLLRALKWSDKVIDVSGDALNGVFNFYDTRANIYYKLEMKKEALADEQKAIEIARNQGSSKVKDYVDVKKKMENGEPTW